MSEEARENGSVLTLDVDLVDGDLYDRLHGGWLGRCVGQGGPSEETTDNIHNLIGLESKGLDYRHEDKPAVSPDLWAFVYPGQPGRAAELASLNATGLASRYRGEYACLAAMISASFALSDVREIVEIGARTVGFDTPESAGDTLGIHKISRSLLQSEGDFDKSLNLAVLGSGVAGAVGCVLGVMLESQGVPESLKAPLNDRITNPVEGGTIRISELGRRTLEVVRRLGTNP